MREKTLYSAMLCMAGLFTASMARAADAPTAPPAAANPGAAAAPPTTTATVGAAGGAEASKMRLGLTLIPMPFGSLKTNVLGGEISSDTSFAFGVMPVFDYLVNPNFFVGFGPSYTLNVKSKDGSGDAAKELDLMLRVGGGLPVAEKIGVYGYLSPGYSIIFPPEGDKPKGLVLGFHAGGMMDVASNVFVNAEIGYQLGFQKVSFRGTDIDLKSNFFQIGLGVGMHI
jgi:Outer membrane protein beta-barrel domain